MFPGGKRHRGVFRERRILLAARSAMPVLSQAVLSSFANCITYQQEDLFPNLWIDEPQH